MERLHTLSNITIPTQVMVDPWAGLRERILGAVISPDDPRYSEARQAWNRTVVQHPAVIVIAENSADVVEAVRFARESGLRVAVQATGHGNVRPADGALLILTSAMQELRVDATTQTAWVGAGVKWGRVLAAAQAVGLAPLLGSSPDVGAVGYTLGGGMGWLARQYGLSADHVRRFEVVTVDGQLRPASADENRDLFWGLRGGGGSLGIVTGMEIELFPLTTVYAGNLFYPMAMAREVLRHYRAWVATLPETLTSSIVIMNFPPIPEVPEPLRGQSFVLVRGCFTGSVAEGEALLESWRRWRTPLIDDFKAMPFSNAGKISDEPEEPMPAFSTAAWLHSLSDEVIDALVQYGPAANGSPLAVIEIRHAGGAVKRVQPGSVAFSNRDAEHLIHMIGMTPTPDAQRAVSQYTGQFKQAIQGSLTGTVYMNLIEGEESQQRIQDGYKPEAYARLQTLKAKYDADNRLGFGFNIRPA